MLVLHVYYRTQSLYCPNILFLTKQNEETTENWFRAMWHDRAPKFMSHKSRRKQKNMEIWFSWVLKSQRLSAGLQIQLRLVHSGSVYVTSTTCLSSSIRGANSFSRLMMRPEGKKGDFNIQQKRICGKWHMVDRVMTFLMSLMQLRYTSKIKCIQ